MAGNDKAPAYCAAHEIKAALPDGNLGTTYDAILSLLAKRASRALDTYCKVAPGYFSASADSVRTYDGNGKSKLHIDDFAQAPTLVEIDSDGSGTYVSLTASDYRLWPYNALDLGEPYTALIMHSDAYLVWPKGEARVRVTARFGGFVTVPDDVKQLAIIQAARWFKRGQQGFADVGGIIELGQLRYVKGLDPDVAELCKSYKGLAI